MKARNSLCTLMQPYLQLLFVFHIKYNNYLFIGSLVVLKSPGRLQTYEYTNFKFPPTTQEVSTYLRTNLYTDQLIRIHDLVSCSRLLLVLPSRFCTALLGSALEQGCDPVACDSK